MRAAAILAGVAILAAATWVAIEAAHLSGAHAALVSTLAVGTAVGAVVMARSSFLVGAAVAAAVLCGEGYGMLATAERIIAVRETVQAPVNEAKRLYRAATARVQEAEAAVASAPVTSVRLAAATEARARADAEVAAKAAVRDCAVNCRELLTAAVNAAAREIDAAHRALQADRDRLAAAVVVARTEVAGMRLPPATGTALADRIGVMPWIVDLIAAGLLTLGANGLAAMLIAWGAHMPGVAMLAPVRQQPTAAMALVAPPLAVAESKAPEITASAIEVVKLVGDFVGFLAEVVEPDEAGWLAERELAAAYVAWCRRGKWQPVGAEVVAQGIEMFSAMGNIARVERGGERGLVGVKLMSRRRLAVA